MISYDVVIIGAGPGGLVCAEVAASHGMRTLVLERKKRIGCKVCAGGITWNGLLKTIANQDIVEKTFPVQHIFSRHQSIVIKEEQPVIATVNREKLGELMASKAISAGAVIRPRVQVLSIDNGKLLCMNRDSNSIEKIGYSFLVGADGSTSLVRRSLGLPIEEFGVGINYTVPGEFDQMEWHLDSQLFSSGYCWIFPHKETASIGGYVHSKKMSPKNLQLHLNLWGKRNGLDFSSLKPGAERINFDFRGYRFGNIFLVGDSAGLASGLTGEGIYPAIVSGECVGNILATSRTDTRKLDKLIKNNIRHRKMVNYAGKNKLFATLLTELIVFCLRRRLLNFSAAEMAS